jgi:hypothetical protein
VSEEFVLIDQPGLRITVGTHGGGTHALHYVLSINGEELHDDSSSHAYSTREAFPDRDDLRDWIEEVELASNVAYHKGERLQ